MNGLILLVATAVTFFSFGAVLGAISGYASAGLLMNLQQGRNGRLVGRNRKLEEQLGLDKEFPL